MPRFEWKCEECKQFIEVDRKVNENNVEPTDDELNEAKWKYCLSTHRLKKIMGRTSWQRGGSWNYKKGYVP